MSRRRGSYGRRYYLDGDHLIPGSFGPEYPPEWDDEPDDPDGPPPPRDRGPQ